MLASIWTHTRGAGRRSETLRFNSETRAQRTVAEENGLLFPFQFMEDYHRIYDGAPLKTRDKKRLSEISPSQDVPLFPAKLLKGGGQSPDKIPSPSLSSSPEILITHTSDTLALGYQTVIVIEALQYLEEKFNIAYESVAGMREYADVVQALLHDVNKDCYHGFARFCYGIFKTIAVHAVPTQRMASLQKYYESVCESVKLDNPSLSPICTWTTDVVIAWSQMFLLQTKRHQLSHPFKFIQGDVCIAKSVLNVLINSSLSEDYTHVKCLICASISLIQEEVSLKEKVQQDQLESFKEHLQAWKLEP